MQLLAAAQARKTGDRWPRVLVGPRKVGLSQQVAIRAARLAHPVLFLSQEMEAEELADRGRANPTVRIDADGKDLERGLPHGRRVERGAPDPDVRGRPALTMTVRHCAKAQIVPGLKLLIVDYLRSARAGEKTATETTRSKRFERLASRDREDPAHPRHRPVATVAGRGAPRQWRAGAV